MKARVIETGKIEDVVANGNYYDTTDNKERYYSYELDFNDTHDYWTRLEHQYAGMAMQGMLNNSYLAGEFRKDPNNGIEDMSKIITKAAVVYAHALVEKMKEERK